MSVKLWMNCTGCKYFDRLYMGGCCCRHSPEAGWKKYAAWPKILIPEMTYCGDWVARMGDINNEIERNIGSRVSGQDYRVQGCMHRIL